MKKYITPMPFLYLTTSLIIGVLLSYHLVSIERTTWLYLCLALTTLNILLLFWNNPKQPKLLKQLLLLLNIITVGATTTAYSLPFKDKKWYGHTLEKTEAYYVKIISPPEVKRKTILYNCSIIKSKAKNKWQYTNGTFKLYLYKHDSLKLISQGSSLIVPNQLQQIKNSNNPYSFQQATFINKKGYFHQMFLSREALIQLKAPLPPPSFINNTKKRIAEIINNNVPDSSAAAVMKAISINDRTSLDEKAMADYRNTGVFHLLAISGMHIGILFGVLLWLLNVFKKTPRRPWTHYLMALALIWFYIFITGLPPSAVRAGVMVSLFSIGKIYQHKQHSLNLLFATAFLLLLFRPLWIFDIGFQLSFVAVLSIFLFYSPIFKLLNSSKGLLRILWSIIALNCSVQLLVAPLVLYYFHNLPILSIIANIPATLFSILFMNGTFILVLLGSLGVEVVWLGEVLSYIHSTFNQIISFFATHTPDQLQQIQIGWAHLLLLYISIAGISFALIQKHKKALWLGLSATIALGFSLIGKRFQQMQQEQFIIYNSPKNTLVQVIKGNRSVLYTDSIHPLSHKYCLEPATIGYQLNKTVVKGMHQRILAWKDQKILFLNAQPSFKSAQKYTVNILILSNGTYNTNMLWLKNFQFERIVIDGSVPRYKAKKVIKALKKMELNYHWVQDHGAFIL